MIITYRLIIWNKILDIPIFDGNIFEFCYIFSFLLLFFLRDTWARNHFEFNKGSLHWEIGANKLIRVYLCLDVEKVEKPHTSQMRGEMGAEGLDRTINEESSERSPLQKFGLSAESWKYNSPVSQVKPWAQGNWTGPGCHADLGARVQAKCAQCKMCTDDWLNLFFFLRFWLTKNFTTKKYSPSIEPFLLFLSISLQFYSPQTSFPLLLLSLPSPMPFI